MQKLRDVIKEKKDKRDRRLLKFKETAEKKRKRAAMERIQKCHGNIQAKRGCRCGECLRMYQEMNATN